MRRDGFFSRIFASTFVMVASGCLLSACQLPPQEIIVRLRAPVSAPAVVAGQAEASLDTKIVVVTPSPVPIDSPSVQSPNVQAELTPLSLDYPIAAPIPTPIPEYLQTPQVTPVPVIASESPPILDTARPTPAPTVIASETPLAIVTPTPIPIPSISSSPEPYQSPEADAMDFTNSLGMHFRKLPSGSFLMGSLPTEVGRLEDEAAFEASIQGFWLQSTEVTQAQWQAVMGFNPSFYPNDPQQPVEMVTWYDAADFISRLNQRGEGLYRLPSEAEWEYAARAGSSTAYACGDVSSCLNIMSWYVTTTGGTKTRAVATKAPNDWGLYDMHGNVSEWVNDWYGPYPTTPQNQPIGPALGTLRVNRGGSWGGQPSTLRSAKRTGHAPTALSSKLGFRVVFVP